MADLTLPLLSGLNQPNGVAWHNGSLYVAEVSRITRYDDVDASVMANKVCPAVHRLSLLCMWIVSESLSACRCIGQSPPKTST